MPGESNDRNGSMTADRDLEDGYKRVLAVGYMRLGYALSDDAGVPRAGSDILGDVISSFQEIYLLILGTY